MQAGLPNGAPDTAATRRVAEALARHGMDGRLKALEETARSAAEAAAALGVGVEAIVKTLIFDLEAGEGASPVAVLVSGDLQCDTSAIPAALGVPGAPGTGGKVVRPDADRVKAVTGYSIGGVSPVGLPDDVEVLVDAALARSETVWAAAGHTHLVFGCTFAELLEITGGRAVEAIAKGS